MPEKREKKGNEETWESQLETCTCHKGGSYTPPAIILSFLQDQVYHLFPSVVNQLDFNGILAFVALLLFFVW